MGKIEALCVSENKGEQKKPVESVLLRTEHGIEGDGHAGPWHRQVSLLAAEDIETVRQNGLPDIKPGDFAENIIVSGVDLSALGIGTKLHLGDTIISITQIGKECHTPCEIFHKTGDCIMPRLGLFARVESGGELKVGDPAEAVKIVTPVFGCILIGGKSSRMGEPKHLIDENGTTWLQKTHALLEQVTEKVVIAGAGDVPREFNGCVRLSDVSDTAGPMAGILAAMRWAPCASWLVTACDMPHLSAEALQWLLASRAPGVWATIPRLSASPRVEPLLAYYDPKARDLLEDMVARGISRPGMIVENNNVISPTPPDHLAKAWRNINTKGERG
jgi:molybdopterin-guanine dinucleotide biosynthesis protein A